MKFLASIIIFLLTFSVLAGAASSKMDLVITNMTTTPASPQIGEQVTLKVTVKNIGTGKTPASTLRLKFASGGIYETATPTLNAGGAYTSSFPIGQQPFGSSVYVAVADATNVIAESNELNNNKSITIYIPQTLNNLQVNSTPDNARTYLNGVYKGQTPMTINNLALGTYNLTLTKQFYQDYSTSINVGAGPVVVFNAILTPTVQEGSISMSSNPQGANVYVEGVFAGVTPVVITRPAGTYAVKLTKQGYADYDYTITVLPGQTVYDGNPTLTPIVQDGFISINSNPQGANAYVDGVSVGVSPVTVSRPAGQYTVKLTKEGYADYETTVSVSAGSTVSISPTLFEFNPTGNLFLTSNPTGASIYLNTWLQGTTPLNFFGLTAATYDLRITKEGYQDYVSTVTVIADQTVYLNVNLTSSTGDLNVESTPTGADIYFDGVFSGRTPLTLTGITPGTHTVNVTLNGYVDNVQQVQIYVNQVTYVTAGLTPKPTTGDLSLDSVPQGAYAYVDLVYKGTTPVTVTGISPGPHNVKISKTGYVDSYATVSIIAGSTTVYSPNLAQNSTNSTNTSITGSVVKSAKKMSYGKCYGICNKNLTGCYSICKAA